MSRDQVFPVQAVRLSHMLLNAAFPPDSNHIPLVRKAAMASDISIC